MYDVVSNSALYSLFLSFTEKHHFTEMHSINMRFASCNLLSFIPVKVKSSKILFVDLVPNYEIVSSWFKKITQFQF